MYKLNTRLMYTMELDGLLDDFMHVLFGDLLLNLYLQL